MSVQPILFPGVPSATRSLDGSGGEPASDTGAAFLALLTLLMPGEDTRPEAAGDLDTIIATGRPSGVADAADAAAPPAGEPFLPAVRHPTASPAGELPAGRPVAGLEIAAPPAVASAAARPTSETPAVRGAPEPDDDLRDALLPRVERPSLPFETSLGIRADQAMMPTSSADVARTDAFTTNPVSLRQRPDASPIVPSSVGDERLAVRSGADGQPPLPLPANPVDPVEPGVLRAARAPGEAPLPAQPQAPPPPAAPAATQVGLEITRAASNRIEHMVVRLEPAELGRVEVDLSFDDHGRLTAVIATDRVETLDILQRDSHALERSLQEAGLRADNGSLSFSLRREPDRRGETGTGRSGGSPGGEDGTATTPAEGVRATSARLLDIHA